MFSHPQLPKERKLYCGGKLYPIFQQLLGLMTPIQVRRIQWKGLSYHLLSCKGIRPLLTNLFLDTFPSTPKIAQISLWGETAPHISTATKANDVNQVSRIQQKGDTQRLLNLQDHRTTPSVKEPCISVKNPACTSDCN
jgi:hypothetical protein